VPTGTGYLKGPEKAGDSERRRAFLEQREARVVKIPKNKSSFFAKIKNFCSKQLKTKKRIDKKGKML
jgi:hypothetical protein